MNAIKRFSGILWLLAGAVAGYYLLVEQALPKFGTGKPEDLIPAGIYTFILCPLIVARSNEHMRRVLYEKIDHIPGVLKTESLIDFGAAFKRNVPIEE